MPGTFTCRFKKILQEGDLPDNLNVHSLRPVSYTHLDVYKRQPEWEARPQAAGLCAEHWSVRCTWRQGAHSVGRCFLLYPQTPFLTMWALILPTAVSTYNLIIMRTFFESTSPFELVESASLDGCNCLLYTSRCV